MSVNAEAITVNVRSTGKSVTGLGFIVHGKQYGGLGSSYSKQGTPVGIYSFGVRDGRDIACKLVNGKKSIKLHKNTTAFLKYDGNKSLLRISS